jgi:hypothetical protein
MAVLLSVGTLAAHANAGEEEKFFGCWAPPQNKELPGQGNEICFKPHGEVKFIHFEPSLVEGFVYQWKLLRSNKIKLGSDTCKFAFAAPDRMTLEDCPDAGSYVIICASKNCS